MKLPPTGLASVGSFSEHQLQNYILLLYKREAKLPQLHAATRTRSQNILDNTTSISWSYGTDGSDDDGEGSGGGRAVLATLQCDPRGEVTAGCGCWRRPPSVARRLELGGAETLLFMQVLIEVIAPAIITGRLPKAPLDARKL
jgi:hypothetical protein